MRKSCLWFLLLVSLIFPTYIATGLISTRIVMSRGRNNMKSNDMTIELNPKTVGRDSIHVISTESTGDSIDPAITVDKRGAVHVVWSDITDYRGAETDSDIFYKQWDVDTCSWTSITVFPTSSTAQSISPVIAGDDLSYMRISFQEGAEVFSSFWDSYQNDWMSCPLSPRLSEGSENPALAVDGSGENYIVWEEWGRDTTIYFTYYNHALRSYVYEWVAPECTRCSVRPAIAVDGAKNAHVVWMDTMNYSGAGIDFDIFYRQRDYNTSPIDIIHSDPWTSIGNWSSIEIVSIENVEGAMEPAIAIDNSGGVHVVWSQLTGYTNNDIFYRYRTSGMSGNWSTTELISTNSAKYSNFPAIAVDDTRNVHVVWEEWCGDIYGNVCPGTHTDILYKYRNVTTGTWTQTEEVFPGNSEDSKSPAIAVDGKGNVHIVWEDYSNYNGSGIDADIFYKKLIYNPDICNPDICNPDIYNSNFEIPGFRFILAIFSLMTSIFIINVLKKPRKILTSKNISV